MPLDIDDFTFSTTSDQPDTSITRARTRCVRHNHPLGGSFDCGFDGAAVAPCASPLSLAVRRARRAQRHARGDRRLRARDPSPPGVAFTIAPPVHAAAGRRQGRAARRERQLPRRRQRQPVRRRQRRSGGRLRAAAVREHAADGRRDRGRAPALGRGVRQAAARRACRRRPGSSRSRAWPRSRSARPSTRARARSRSPRRPTASRPATGGPSASRRASRPGCSRSAGTAKRNGPRDRDRHRRRAARARPAPSPVPPLGPRGRVRSCRWSSRGSTGRSAARRRRPRKRDLRHHRPLRRHADRGRQGPRLGRRVVRPDAASDDAEASLHGRDHQVLDRELDVAVRRVDAPGGQGRAAGRLLLCSSNPP